jgi:hypothetical protein
MYQTCIGLVLIIAPIVVMGRLVEKLRDVDYAVVTILGGLTGLFGCIFCLAGVMFTLFHLADYKREYIDVYWLHHYLTKMGEYHHHDYDPRSVPLEAETLAFHCKVAHGGWWRRSVIITDGDPKLVWQIEWASPINGPDESCWMKIQSVQNRRSDQTPWPSMMSVPAEQALRIMARYGSTHAFVEKAFDVMWYEKPNLVNTVDKLQRRLDSEEDRVSGMAKDVIRMLYMFDAMKTTVGRTKHAQAIKGPLEDMLKHVGDEELVNELKTEVFNELVAQQSAPTQSP